MLVANPTHPIQNAMRKSAIARRLGCPGRAWLVTINGVEACIPDLVGMIQRQFVGKVLSDVPMEAIGPKTTYTGTPSDFLALLLDNPHP